MISCLRKLITLERKSMLSFTFVFRISKYRYFNRISVEGVIEHRDEETYNPKIPTGTIELEVTNPVKGTVTINVICVHVTLLFLFSYIFYYNTYCLQSRFICSLYLFAKPVLSINYTGVSHDFHFIIPFTARKKSALNELSFRTDFHI